MSVAISQAGAAGPSAREPQRPLHLPELLAPAGDWECARAAVENGADAIYFGLERFNARMRAHNFTEADLPRLIEFLHRRGVKGYVTFNTLVFQNELLEAERYLRSIIAAGVDAAIVQDVGICRLIRRLSPDFPIHASTQMTVTSATGIEFARELGCNLVVLARENSLKDIMRIRSELRVASSEFRVPGSAFRVQSSAVGRVSSRAVDAEQGGVGSSGASSQPNNPEPGTRNLELPLEVFVHGALCVAYSGQCLTSEALGGRSANRGECAQACRMPYELISDGKAVPLGDRRYLLSPQDLAGLEVLPELVRVGVASLKIEGRLKTPGYVASITRLYRQAVDRIVEGRGSRVEVSGDARPSTLVPRQAQYEMQMAFSRGLSTGWLRGIDNQRLVHARFGKKRGVFVGEVTGVQGCRVFVRLEGALKAGDGIVFDAGRPEEKEEGGRVFEVQGSKFQVQSEVALTFGHGMIDFNRVHAGDRVWKTSDPELDRRLRQSFEGEQPRFQRPVHAEIHGRAGQALTLLMRDEEGHVARVDSTMPLAPAEKQPLGKERLRGQLGRLGGTAFKLGRLENHLEGAVMLPVSELNRLRREAVAELDRQRAQPRRWQTDLRFEASQEHPSPLADNPQSAIRNPQLIVLVRSLPQLEAALTAGVATVYCDFEDPKKYRDAVARFRARQSETEILQSAIRTPQSEIWVAPPRIFKPGEEWILKQVRSCDADGYLVRNYDNLRFFGDCRRMGDFSLNVANALAADYFKNQFELERLTASYDLNGAQLEALVRAAPPEWFEVTIHQHIPMFHMEHCVFCAFLSQGTDFTNCGRPCDRHEVRLRDRVGAEHPLKADLGCRNTVFNARAQTGAEHVEKLLALGVRHFRIEFVTETPDLVATTIAKYRQLLSGQITGAELWRELKLLNQLGVTRGTHENP